LLERRPRTLLAYCLYICRTAEDPDADPAPIPLDEWRAAVTTTEGVRLFADKYHIVSNPLTMQTITISARVGDAEVFFPDDGRWYSVFSWFEGSASFNARLEPGDVSHPVWAAAVSLAARLGAVIRGEEGETYDLRTGRAIKG
jgi:hypothetical protein